MKRYPPSGNVKTSAMLLRPAKRMRQFGSAAQKSSTRSDHSLTFHPVVQILSAKKTTKISRQQRLAFREEIDENDTQNTAQEHRGDRCRTEPRLALRPGAGGNRPHRRDLRSLRPVRSRRFCRL